jgi:hypothetical protein
MSQTDSQPWAPPDVPFARGVTVMPEWFAHEGIDFVLDRVQALGATAIATSPYVLERCADGTGAREPPPMAKRARSGRSTATCSAHESSSCAPRPRLCTTLRAIANCVTSLRLHRR